MFWGFYPTLHSHLTIDQTVFLESMLEIKRSRAAHVIQPGC